MHDHVLVCANHAFVFNGKPVVLDGYRNQDDDQRRKRAAKPVICSKSLAELENLYFPIQDETTGKW